MRGKVIAMVCVLLATGSLSAADTVGVPGSENRFETEIESTFGDKKIKMVLTGTAMRKRLIFNVYAVGSYVQKGKTVKTPEELAAAECLKQLHLVMERDVAADDVVNAFTANIRANYPEPQFNEEIEALKEFLSSTPIRKGDHIWLSHVPGKGLHCYLAGKDGKHDRFIKNPKFPRAVWDIYFGPNNLGETVKKGLTSRL